MNLLAGIAIAFIIAFNPITIVQISNFYVDGTLCLSLFLILYACFSIGEDSNEDKELLKENFFILASSIIWCINAKFTGLAFAGIFCCAFYFYWLYKSYKEDKANFRKKFITYTCFFIVYEEYNRLWKSIIPTIWKKSR